MSSISCICPTSLSGFLLKTYSRCKSAQILKITECIGVRENRMCRLWHSVFGILYCHQKGAEWCSFCKNQLKKTASLEAAVMEFDPYSNLCIGDGVRRWSPSNCCPSLWCRKVASCIRENLESRAVGTLLHFSLFTLLWSFPAVPSARLAPRDLGETQMAQNLLFTVTVLPQCKRYFAVQRILLSLQQGLYENASRLCLPLYPFIKRTRGDAGRRACLSHIPVRLQGRRTGFCETRRKTKRCPAHFPRLGRTLFCSCERDFPMPGIAL